MKARLHSNITFYQVLIKIKFWFAIVQVKVMTSLIMTSYNSKFYGIKSNIEIWIVCLAKTKFLTNEILFFIKRGLYNKKCPLQCQLLSVNIFITIKTLFLNS